MKDEQYMRMALALARKGIGTTSPNPMVGAVLVKGDTIVGKGYHKRAGSAHAEINAIEDAGSNAAGSTMYINLEPCVHYGKTPPCADQVIAAEIGRVFVAMLDPNPLVNGKGVEMLRKAGIDVKVGMLENEARRLNEAFIGSMEKKRPYITMKAAVSLDGKIATKTCDSRWISNEESRRQANILRCVNDGIMVGINTVISDNPMLVPRVKNPKKIPARIILDSKLRIPLASDIVKTSDKYRTWIFTNEDSRTDKETRLKACGADVIRVPKDDFGRVSVNRICQELYKRNITSVLVEGGGEVNSTFLREGLVDKVVLFYGTILIGGKSALNLVGGKGIDFLKDAYRIDIATLKKLKDNIYIEGYVHRNH